MRHFALALIPLLLGAGSAAQQPASQTLIVTTLPSHGEALPAIAAAQVSVQQGHDRDAVLSWQPCTGANAPLELGIVLDDDAQGLGSSMDDLKAFINGLPATTAVALVYMHTSTVTIAQALTTNHANAVKNLRLPNGGTSSSPSPYGSLQTLMAKWPRHPGRRREMIFISDGEEHNGGNDANNVTFKTAVQDTVASNVVAYTILVTGAPDNMSSGALGVPLGAAGAGFGALKAVQTQTNNGSENLSVLAEATGGEAYSQGDGTPARLEQFLKDIGERLANQYTLRIAPAPSKGETMVGLKVEVKETKAKITAPKQIVLPQKSD